MRMPGKNISKAAPLSSDEFTLREELRADVQKLAGEIGERNMWHYAQLNAAADFIENSLSQAGLHPRRDSYELRGQACHNIEAEIPGTRPEVLLIGAHYDSVFGSPALPSLVLGAFYPNVGNFIGFVSNVHSRTLLRRIVSLFRKHAKIPSEGAALPSFVPGVSWSDQWSFWRHGYPGIMVTDTAPF